MCVFSTAVFRTIAALTRHETKAQAVGAGMLCLVINTCGFTLTRSKCGGVEGQAVDRFTLTVSMGEMGVRRGPPLCSPLQITSLDR